jgi:hypothetical protein
LTVASGDPKLGGKGSEPTIDNESEMEGALSGCGDAAAIAVGSRGKAGGEGGGGGEDAAGLGAPPDDAAVNSGGGFCDAAAPDLCS